MEATNLQVPSDNLTEPVNSASSRLDNFKTAAQRQKEAVAKTKNSTKTAINASQGAREKVQEVLNKLKELLSEIDNLETLDAEKLAELEGRLDNEKHTVRQVDREIQSLETEHQKIKLRIEEYTVDLERLRKERELVEKNFESLPKVCPIKSKPGEEG